MPKTSMDLSLEHLQVELGRIDLLVRQEVRRWQLAGQDPNDNFRGLYMTDEQVNATLNRPFGTNWGHTIELSAEDNESIERGMRQLKRYTRDIRERARRMKQPLRLDHLTQAFNLNPFEVDTLLICLAPHLDLRYERVYGYLQDDITRKRPTINLILDLLCEPGLERIKQLPHFADNAPLFKYHIMERSVEQGAPEPPMLRQPLTLDKAVVTWMLGDYQTNNELLAYTNLILPRKEKTNGVLSQEIRDALQTAVKKQPAIIFHGSDKANQQAAAIFFASQLLQRPLLIVNLGGVISAGIEPLQAMRTALRDAHMTNAIPYLIGWDAVLDGHSPPPAIFTELCEYPDHIIVAGEKQWHPKGINRTRYLLWLEFDIPNYLQRISLWEHYIANKEITIATGDLDLNELSGQFGLATGQIRDAVSSAMDIATHQSRELKMEDLFLAARMHSNPSLSNLAHKIVPRYTWDDIILPDDQLTILHELIATVRGRALVLETWGVGKKLASSKGVTVLFAGPPGTGKTMSAEVVANELHLDLYKIDLSTIVSKYIGETEKNLEKIFAEAQSSNAILFFDEADALFGKRSEVKDAHDRYANIETSYLLQRMENYDGVTVLATNLRANLDEAFTRRLQFALDVPFPEKEYRLRIWKTLFPVGVPRSPDIDFEYLTNRFRLAGGNIRNIIISAAFLAASEKVVVDMKHLLHATRRELQKMGRLIKEEDLKFEKAKV